MSEVTVPNLPGYICNDVKAKKHNKSHVFDVMDGLKVVDKKRHPETKPSEIGTIPAGKEFYEWKKDLGVPDPSVSTKRIASTVNQLPQWVMFDKAVLRFWAWTEERVLFSNEEKNRVRLFRILYYLDDDTLQISEDVTENSGISQGLFLKRQQVPHFTEDRYLKYSDIKMENITLFGKSLTLYKVDEFTREFYEKLNLPLGEDSEPPMDGYSLKRSAASEHAAPDTTISSFAEALLGKQSHMQFVNEKKFLQHDRKVLRFWAIWNDPQVYGQTHRFIVLYYISDDSISVHEIYPENAGTFPFPTFLGRQKLPKEHRSKGVALIGEDPLDLKEGDYYTHEDLRIGGYITVYNRHMLLTSCDAYTKCFYMDEYNMEESDFVPIEESSRTYEIPKLQLAPHSGFGTEEDSLASVHHLVPRVPRKNYIKLLQYDNVVLRFETALVNDVSEDVDRRFVIEFYRADDTIKVFEVRAANSGFVGGKFLERTKLKNPATSEWFTAEEFYVGAELVVNGFHFKILAADEHTMSHMEDESSTFSFASPDAILKKLAKKLWNRRQSRTQTFRFIDSNHDRYIDKHEFNEMMKTYGWKLSQHELLTIWRKYDTNGDGRITADEFFKVLERYMHEHA
jgi:hypothetical protein